MRIARMIATGVLGGGKTLPTASIGATTTGAETVTIAELTVSAGNTVTVSWGDGLSDTYSAGSGARTHNYAGAGTWNITFSNPTAITKLTLNNNKLTVNSASLKNMTNMLEFSAGSCKAGRFDSADVSEWRPEIFNLYSMPAGYAGTFNSTDVSAWRPTYFYLHSMPAGYAGTFNSTDVSSWSPTNFYLNSMPAGYAGTFDSPDVSSWRPKSFYLHSMPAGYAGTFNSTDVSSWSPKSFYLNSMPAGYAGTFNSTDVSEWRPTNFHMSGMPAGYTITASAGGFAGWVSTTTLNVSSNSLLSATVTQILADFWAGFATRSATGGEINVGGTNQAPSGTFQAANPPTMGKEFAYELLNDSQNVNPTKKWATVTFTA